MKNILLTLTFVLTSLAVLAYEGRGNWQHQPENQSGVSTTPELYPNQVAVCEKCEKKSNVRLPDSKQIFRPENGNASASKPSSVKKDN